MGFKLQNCDFDYEVRRDALARYAMERHELDIDMDATSKKVPPSRPLNHPAEARRSRISTPCPRRTVSTPRCPLWMPPFVDAWLVRVR